MADRDEQVGVAARLEYQVERLERVTACLRSVERCPTAREQKLPVREALARRHLSKPIRLGMHRRPCFFAKHRSVYSIRPMDGFDFVHRESVRFRDLDGMGHVNNAVFMTYMESARLEYFKSLGLGRNPLEGMILARAEVDFRSPIELGEQVEVGVRTGRIGTKSFDLDQEVRADGRVAAVGKFVLVAYDYTTNRSQEIPESWRERLEGVPV
jgi:acyl-CoA thioester hydrolase